MRDETAGVRRRPQPALSSARLSSCSSRSAIGVPHGPVPALAYVIRTHGRTVAFSGDQNGSDDAFWELAKGADLLIMDSAVPEKTDPVAGRLHATPSVIGMRAANAAIKHVVLSHLMARSLNTLGENVDTIRSYFKGDIDVASDLSCYPLEELPSSGS